MLPERFYLPARGRSISTCSLPTDSGDLLRLQGNGALLVVCAGGRGRGVDICWQYPEPLDDADKIRGMVAVLQRARRPDR